MMIILLASLLAATVPLQCREFNNPILSDGNFPQPSMITLNGTYYIVTATYENQTKKFPIHTSTDLSSWSLKGYIFDESNIPQWSSKDDPFLAPRLHKIGSNYHIYFTATNSATDMLSIGVAIAPHPLGPYTATDRPLLSDPSAHFQEASIINDEQTGNLYLIWIEHNLIKGRKLNSNGLSFLSSYSTNLLNSSTEDDKIAAPYYARRNGRHYIMYFQNNINKQSLLCSHSNYPLGPFKGQISTSLDSNDYIKKPGYAGLVKDLNDKDEVIVFHTLQSGGKMNSEAHWVTNLASVIWYDHYKTANGLKVHDFIQP